MIIMNNRAMLMTKPLLPKPLATFYANQHHQFWFFQLIGWSGLSLVSFFSLNLWYNQPELSYLAHNIVQSLLGALLSWPLRYIFHVLWAKQVLFRLCFSIIAVVVFALAWSVLRLASFMFMTGESGLWPDFGGWLFPSIFIFLCWSALYHGMKYYRLLQEEHASLIEIGAANKEAELKRIQAESIAKEAQLKMLRYQLNPHFLFNTLNAISSLVQMKQAEMANQMIVQLSRFLRYSLENDPIQRVAFSQEIDALQLYLKIEQTRFGERLVVNIDVEDNVLTALIPSLLLQPLVENSIKYAIAPSEAGGTISLIGKKKNNYLEIELIDSGIGISLTEAQFAEGSGVGLRNTRDRLETLYGADFEFTVNNTKPCGFHVLLRLPLSFVPQDTDKE